MIAIRLAIHGYLMANKLPFMNIHDVPHGSQNEAYVEVHGKYVFWLRVVWDPILTFLHASIPPEMAPMGLQGGKIENINYACFCHFGIIFVENMFK